MYGYISESAIITADAMEEITNELDMERDKETQQEAESFVWDYISNVLHKRKELDCDCCPLHDYCAKLTECASLEGREQPSCAEILASKFGADFT